MYLFVYKNFTISEISVGLSLFFYFFFPNGLWINNTMHNPDEKFMLGPLKYLGASAVNFAAAGLTCLTRFKDTFFPTIVFPISFRFVLLR